VIHVFASQAVELLSFGLRGVVNKALGEKIGTGTLQGNLGLVDVVLGQKLRKGT
jgi:hypothetical protein